MMSSLQHLASQPLNTEEMEAILNAYGLVVPICLYSDIFYDGAPDLIDYIDSLPNKAVIMLFRSEPTYGHWITLFLRRGPSGIADTRNLYVYDSMGLCMPDDWKSLMRLNKLKLAELGQDGSRLIGAVLKSGFQSIYWNDYEIQSPSPEIQTCGRHCIIRLLCQGLSVKKYYDRLNAVCASEVNPLINGHAKGLPGTKYDYLATALTDLSPINNALRLELYNKFRS
jgi:hypothetical protein